MAEPYEQVLEGTKTIKREIRTLSLLAQRLYAVGLDGIADNIQVSVVGLSSGLSDVVDGVDSWQDKQLQQAQQATANMLNAVIAATKEKGEKDDA